MTYMPCFKNTLACLLLIFIFYGSVLAQDVPGYRGKRFMAGYTINIGHNALSSGYIYTSDKFRLHYKHGIAADYLSNRFTSLGGEVSYLNAPIGTFVERIDTQNIIGSSLYISMSAGATMKKFYGIKNGLIAPIGGFVKYKLFLEKMYVEETFLGAKSKKYKYWSPGFGIAYGQSRVLGNSVRLEGAIELDVLLGTFIGWGDLIISRTANDRHDMAYYHLLGYSSTVRLGLSGLLF